MVGVTVLDVSSHRGTLFRRHILQGVGSSGAAFVVTLLTTPVMTRIFPAEAYGAYGLINTAATVISGIGLLGLPVALARAQTGAEQVRLLAASIQVATIFCALVAAGAVLVFLAAPASVAAASAGLILLLPVVVLCHAAQRISDSLASARGLFPPLAVARTVSAIASRGLTLAVGWMAEAATGAMVLGDVAGRALHVAVTALRGDLSFVWRNLPWRPEPAALRAAIRDYRDFALYSNVAAIIPLVTVLALQALIGIRYGVRTTGLFVLALSILSLPVTLLALASAPVIFHRLVRTADETPELLQGFALRAMLFFLSLGAACMLPVTLFGPSLFAFFFGERWRTAGIVAAVLSPPQVLAFSLTALLSLFRVTRRLRLWLSLEVLGSIMVVGGVALVSDRQDFLEAITDMAWLFLGYQVLMHMGCILVLKQHRRPTL